MSPFLPKALILAIIGVFISITGISQKVCVTPLHSVHSDNALSHGSDGSLSLLHDADGYGYFVKSRGFNVRKSGDSLMIDRDTIQHSKIIMITKLDKDGSVLWTKGIGSLSTSGSRLKVTDAIMDKEDNLLICGSFYRTVDFNPAADSGEYTSTSGFGESFVLRLKPNMAYDTVLIFPGRYSRAQKMRLDNKGALLLSGLFTDDMQVNPAQPSQKIYAGSNYGTIFLIKLDANLTYEWAMPFGGVFEQDLKDIVVDKHNNFYIAGSIHGNGNTVDFDPGPGVVSLLPQGTSPFITKFNEEGEFQWVRLSEEPVGGSVYSLALDSQNNIYAIGGFKWELSFGGAYRDETTSLEGKLFFIKLSETNDILGFFTWVSRQFNHDGGDIAVDSQFNTYMAFRIRGDADIDPGDGRLWVRVAEGDVYNTILLKLNKNFEYQWHLVAGADADGSEISVNSAQKDPTLRWIHRYNRDFSLTACDSVYPMKHTQAANRAVWKVEQCSPTESVETITTCGPVTWLDGKTYEADTQNVFYTYPGKWGCDSTVELQLTVNSVDSAEQKVSACDSFTWIDGVTYHDNTAEPKLVLSNRNGCDSILQLNLQVNPSKTYVDLINSCEPIKWKDGNTYSYSVDSVMIREKDIKGCDSNHMLVFNYSKPKVGFDTVNSCRPITWIDGNVYWGHNLMAKHVLKTQNDCDSTVHLVMNLHAENVEVFPNPFHQAFTIDLSAASATDVSIYSMQGQLISRHEDVQGKEFVVSDLYQSGFYILQMNTGCSSKIMKMTKY